MCRCTENSTQGREICLEQQRSGGKWRQGRIRGARHRPSETSPPTPFPLGSAARERTPEIQRRLRQSGPHDKSEMNQSVKESTKANKLTFEICKETNLILPLHHCSQ